MNESDGFKCATLTSVYVRRAACIGMAIRLSVHAGQGLLRSGGEGNLKVQCMAACQLQKFRYIMQESLQITESCPICRVNCSPLWSVWSTVAQTFNVFRLPQKNLPFYVSGNKEQLIIVSDALCSFYRWHNNCVSVTRPVSSLHAL